MQSEPNIKTCESCGEQFGCGAKLDGCWCVEIQLPAEIADDLQAKYQDCLCAKCLQGLTSTIRDRRDVSERLN